MDTVPSFGAHAWRALTINITSDTLPTWLHGEICEGSFSFTVIKCFLDYPSSRDELGVEESGGQRDAGLPIIPNRSPANSDLRLGIFTETELT